MIRFADHTTTTLNLGERLRSAILALFSPQLGLFARTAPSAPLRYGAYYGMPSVLHTS
jgi:hypothetical protein